HFETIAAQCSPLASRCALVLYLATSFGSIRATSHVCGRFPPVGRRAPVAGYPAALLATVPIAAIALRILFEERFLRRELTGYEAYTQRVRCRLIPFLW